MEQTKSYRVSIPDTRTMTVGPKPHPKVGYEQWRLSQSEADE